MGGNEIQTIFLTCNGESTRYGAMGPKWKVSARDGRCLANLALSGLEGEFDVIALIREDENKEEVHNLLSQGKNFRHLRVVGLPTTQSQVETVREGLYRTGHKGSFLVRDCDNYISAEVPKNGTFTMIAELEQCEEIQAGNKSYVRIDERGYVEETAERRVISNCFNVGGYGFASADVFFQASDWAKTTTQVHNLLVLAGFQVKAIKTADFEDWGTAADWRRNRRNGGTIFIDVDGVLLYDNTDRNGAQIKNNINYLNRLKEKGRFALVITTCRPEKDRIKTEQQLTGLQYNHMIMGLPRGRRVLVNDIWPTRGEKSAIAIGLPQNSEHLEAMLQAEGIEL